MRKIKCIDLSKWNGDVDFNKVREDGIEKVILRSSFRHTTDNYFFTNVEKAKAAGVEIAGVYHFSYALTVAQATSEAKYCITLLAEAGVENVMVFFDFEYDTIAKALAAGVQLLPVDANAHAKAFCEYIEKSGYRPGLYMNLDFYENYFDEDIKHRYPVWLADYSGDPDYPCLVHQYTDKGRIDGIVGNVDLDYWYEDENADEKVDPYLIRSAQAVVDLANSWIGLAEYDGSYKKIIDIYNSYSPLPRNVKMEYDWAWCACTWSALAIILGYTDIMPIEISCGFLVDKAKEMEIWVEKDSETPKPGWAVLYDWDDDGKGGDNKGWPDHIGTVTYVNNSTRQIIVVEGNYNNAVKTRTIPFDYSKIRGYIAPRYTDELVNSPTEVTGKPIYEVVKEVIAGAWGNGAERKSRLHEAGYDPEVIQDAVNDALSADASSNTVSNTTAPYTSTKKASCYARSFNKDSAGIYTATADLNLRDGAGTSNKSLVVLKKGSVVRCYGYYTSINNTKWLYVETVKDRTKFIGFCSSAYLKRK